MTEANATCELRVKRIRKGYQDRLRRYKIVVDGRLVGTVKYGRSWSGPIPPGTHRVQLLIDWKSSPEIEITAAPGGSIQLECGPGANVIGGVTQLMGADSSYLSIRQIPSGEA